MNRVPPTAFREFPPTANPIGRVYALLGRRRPRPGCRYRILWGARSNGPFRLQVVMTLVSIPLMDRTGRRTLHLYGLGGMFIFSIFITISFLIKASTERGAFRSPFFSAEEPWQEGVPSVHLAIREKPLGLKSGPLLIDSWTEWWEGVDSVGPVDESPTGHTNLKHLSTVKCKENRLLMTRRRKRNLKGGSSCHHQVCSLTS